MISVYGEKGIKIESVPSKLANESTDTVNGIGSYNTQY